ncbi:MAG: hypothetical protein QG650_79 [Patescibacteria group bacterium]|nr:hypothetical protein [Patescibacteria group bacterium]
MIDAVVERRSVLVFPENSVIQRQHEEVVAGVLRILLPFAKEKPAAKTEYYRMKKLENGSFLCERIPGGSPLFEIDPQSGIYAGTGVPSEVLSYFEREMKKRRGRKS